MYTALQAAGLGEFYALRGERGEPVGELALERRDAAWLDAYLAAQQPLPPEHAHDATWRLSLQVQGLRCAACVWLIERCFARMPGAQQIAVNPARGQLDLAVLVSFDVRAFVLQLEQFGYVIGPAGERPAAAPASDGLLLRLGVTAALAMNSMMFSAATYLGLPAGALANVLHWLNFGAASLAVLIGGPVFIGSAARALRRGMLHFDTPIALGIVLGYAGALYSFLSDTPQVAYFDALCAFIALMLLGRYLQGRAVSRSRAELLAWDEASTLFSRRLRQGRVEVVAVGELRAGDLLLLAPGDLLPAAAVLEDDEAVCSLDWINGEAYPRSFARGQLLPAGAFNLGRSALRLRLRESFAESALRTLLQAPAEPTQLQSRLTRFARYYVFAVLAIASGAFGYWALIAGDWLKALQVATAVSAVACPCAIGLVVPLAHEWTHAALRRAGLFVRSASLLERAQQLRTVVFDKTGTLTTGQLRVTNPQTLRGLSTAQRRALYNLVSRSLHPKSIAIKRELDATEVGFDAELQVQELAGFGLEATVDGRCHRLGRRAWATGLAGDGLCFAVDGQPLADIQLEEQLRPDAKREIVNLAAAGFRLWVLSGDGSAATKRVARALGVPSTAALGDLSPDDKQRWVTAHGPGVLMIGDGINDGPALAAATCAGAPAVGRALVAGRADFYFTSAGLWPVRVMLEASALLARVIRQNIALGVLYNGLAVAAAACGLMQPWLAAVLMPASSIAIVLRTTHVISHGSRTWMS